MSSEFWSRDLFGGSLGALTARFFAWYRNEFFALFPPKTAAWLADRGDRELVLRAGERELWLVDPRGGPAWSLSVDEIAASSLEEALARRGVARKAAKIGLEIDDSAFFLRRFDVPAVAASNIDRLLLSDIERKTPFRLEDVVHGHTIAKHPAAPDKLRVGLWILRRDIVARAIENAGLTLDDLAFVRPVGASAAAAEAPTIVFSERSEPSHLFRNLVIGLCAATAVLLAIGVGAVLWRQAATSEELEAKIAQTSARAAKVRQIADRATAEGRLLAVLRNARRGAPLFADLWEETARILPDGAFVTDLRLTEPKPDERALEIVGFAESAVGLPALFEKSALFSHAGLSAAITPDPREKREGFTLQARVEPFASTARK